MPRSRIVLVVGLGVFLAGVLAGLDRCFPAVEFQDPADPALALLGWRLAWVWVATWSFFVALLAPVMRPWAVVLLLLVGLEAPFAALQARHPTAMRHHPRRGIEPVPGYRNPPIVWHDERGLRGDGVDREKRRYRVLILGDSTLYGAGVSQADTVAERLARATGWEVVNAAAPGTASADGVWLMQGPLADLDPDLLVVGYNNDATPGPPDRERYGEHAILDLKAFAMNHSALVRFLVESDLVAHGRPEPGAGPPRATPDEFEAHLRALASLGIPTVLLDMPEDVEAVGSSPGKLPPEWRERLRRVPGATVYDARGEWPPGHPEWFWPRDHYHLTAAGHAKLATELQRVLQGLRPPDS